MRQLPALLLPFVFGCLIPPSSGSRRAFLVNTNTTSTFSLPLSPQPPSPSHIRFSLVDITIHLPTYSTIADLESTCARPPSPPPAWLVSSPSPMLSLSLRPTVLVSSSIPTHSHPHSIANMIRQPSLPAPPLRLTSNSCRRAPPPRPSTPPPR